MSLLHIILLVAGAIFAALAVFGIGSPRFQLGWAALFCLIVHFLIS